MDGYSLEVLPYRRMKLWGRRTRGWKLQRITIGWLEEVGLYPSELLFLLCISLLLSLSFFFLCIISFPWVMYTWSMFIFLYLLIKVVFFSSKIQSESNVFWIFCPGFFLHLLLPSLPLPPIVGCWFLLIYLYFYTNVNEF